MIFSAVLLNLLFTNGPQMALSVVARDRLGNEGLESIEDFADFKDDQLYQAIKNMRTSIPGVAAVIGALDIIAVTGVAPIPPCIVYIKYAFRPKVASLSLHYYHAIGRGRNPTNMNFTQVLSTFYIECEALIKLSKKTKPKFPHLSKNITPIKWIDYFEV